ncbi:hypothetical protein ACWGA9_35655 [Streptomyces sp. NPDC054950]
MGTRPRHHRPKHRPQQLQHDGPHLPDYPDWLWWRLLYLDTTVDHVPVRLWTLETSAHPRALATHLAATIPTNRETAHDC